MISFEQAAQLLDEAVDRLPPEIFRDLNGGVNLLPEERRDDSGCYIMGLYHHNAMGRYVELFYGSFTAVFPHASRREFRRELEHTLHHELTHHLENKAGDRSLERWDEEQALLRAVQAEPLRGDSVLFCSEDGTLASMALACFSPLCAQLDHRLSPAFCCDFTALRPASLPALAVKAARARGFTLREKPLPLQEDILSGYDLILCMTEAEGDALAERFPALDARIFCLGPKDLHPPRFAGGWGRLLRRLASECALLWEELNGKEAE